MLRRVAALFLFVSLSGCVSAGVRPARFVGAAGGVSTLSADARSIVTDTNADVSLYKPENGIALHALAGLHVTNYFSVQGNYVLNRNALSIVAARTSGSYFEERRASRQQAFIIDGLLYFRNLESWVRPYLSAGVGIVRFASDDPALVAQRGVDMRPPLEFTSTHPALRVAVGIDIGETGRLQFRYSFSETISSNPVSVWLSPPAQRNLANFQNLFGAVISF